MNGPRRPLRRALPWLLGAGLLLAGCGIPSTGVVSAGEPGVGVQQTVKLYFVRADEDGLVLTSQRLEGLGSTTAALTLLVKGPPPAEMKALGLTTLLPRAPIKVAALGTDVAVDVGVPTGKLAPIAVDQIVCTALAASSTSPDIGQDRGPATVTVTAGGVPVHGSPGAPAAPCAKAGRPRPPTAADPYASVGGVRP